MPSELTPEAVGELRVWRNDVEWLIAGDREDLRALWRENTGCTDEEFEEQEFYELPGESKLRIICNEQGEIDDTGEPLELTCAEWIAREGRGLLCTTEH